MAHRVVNAHNYHEVLWTGSNVSFSCGKQRWEWALTFFSRTLVTRSACHSRVTSLDIPYASVKSNCAHHPPNPPPPAPLRGICLPCQSWGWGISKFCVARGSGIYLPRGRLRAFDTHVVSYPNITKHGGFYWKHEQIGGLAQLSRTRKTCTGF